MAKNIVLLSDGTGNSAAKAFKTNVWRLYQAVDTSAPAPGELAQIVYYDDGVGTGDIKPLALLGLAFGIGVADNVKHLYAFLCRNYQPGDNIYLFGFSRGAFTVRILAGLILRCGLVTASSEAELTERVKLAYAEYKRDAARRATRTRGHLMAGHMLGGWRTGSRTAYIRFNFPQLFPRISFVGVWDTVDAYGMPVDELKEGIDRYVWPMTVADRHFSDQIDHACHALSLDDERPTFRPVLWTDPATDPDRLEQVWFAGVHANVGGGYPDDGLACVTLEWMMRRASSRGMRFYDGPYTEYRNRANVHGKLYDSRAGLAGYYRYEPRDVDRLCHDPEHGVAVALPRVSQTAMDRIRARQVGYAPVSFPSRYDVLPARLISAAKAVPPVVRTSWLSRLVEAFVAGTPAAVPPPARAPARVPAAAPEADIAGRLADMESVRDAIFRRRVAYFTTVALTLVLATLPVADWIAARGFLQPPASLSALSHWLSDIPGWRTLVTLTGNVLSWLMELDVAPGWAAFWIRSFVDHPGLFLFCGVVVLWLFVRKSAQIQAQIFERAEYAWRRY